MILELLFERHSQDAETWGSSLTEQQVNKTLVQGCALYCLLWDILLKNHQLSSQIESVIALLMGCAWILR